MKQMEWFEFIRQTWLLARSVAIKRWLAISVFISIGVAYGSLAALFAEHLSSVVNSYEPGTHIPHLLDSIKSEEKPIIALLAICVLISVSLSIGDYVSGKLNAIISADLYSAFRNRAFEICLDSNEAAKSALNSAESDNPTEITSVVNRGADAVSDTYAHLLTTLQQIFVLVSALISSRKDYISITLSCIAVILAQVLLARWRAKSLESKRKEYDNQSNRLQAATAEIISARELLLAFDKTEHFKFKLRELVSKFSEIVRQNAGAEGKFNALNNLIDKFGQIAIVAIAILMVSLAYSWPHEERPLVFALALYGSLLPSARALIHAYDAIRRTEATANSFILIICREENSSDPPLNNWQSGEPICFKNVSFRYKQDDRTIISNLSIKIPPNRITLILGPSGCGKTTIGRMALGFLHPENGTIELGGRKSTEWGSKQRLRAMSYSPQDSLVLDDTVEVNLRLSEGDEPFTQEQMLKALQSVKLSNILSKNAKHAISGGEKQRVAAARIILDLAEIVILDEPLTGVDAFTISEIAPAIEQHWAETNQTVIIISHKLIFAAIASWVVVLDKKGNVTEEGEPSTLLAANGDYARIRAETLRQIDAQDCNTQNCHL